MGARGLTVARLGGGLMALAAVALVYVLAQPGTVIDGRVYGPDVRVPAALLGLGALLVAVVPPKLLEGRLARTGMGFVALGAFAVVATYLVEEGTNPMAALTPLVVAIVSFVGGGLAILISLARSREPTR